MQTHQVQIHTFGPFIPAAARYLFLGTFPSVKSREQQFYYGHPQNQFWRLLADIFGSECPETLQQKQAFLTQHHIGVYDVIAQCEIIGSSDASIRNIVPSDIARIVQRYPIEKILLNGRKAEQIFTKYHPGLSGVYIPSSSPANASMSYAEKLAAWSAAIL